MTKLSHNVVLKRVSGRFDSGRQTSKANSVETKQKQ